LRSTSLVLSGDGTVTSGDFRKLPDTLIESDAEPDFTFLQVAAAAVLDADGAGEEELQAARPATTRAAVRTERDLRTRSQSAPST
ncbi:hypothetical protein, partial [Aeromonas veronii]|uniref:hypothetical protein n=1 Tax=Aeromonas veronii TaxID=654 RepID=UPI003D25A425